MHGTRKGSRLGKRLESNVKRITRESSEIFREDGNRIKREMSRVPRQDRTFEGPASGTIIAKNFYKSSRGVTHLHSWYCVGNERRHIILWQSTIAAIGRAPELDIR